MWSHVLFPFLSISGYKTDRMIPIETAPGGSKIPVIVGDDTFHSDKAPVELYSLGIAGITCDVVFFRQPVIEA